jgi:predicted ATP-grasp superfamily ATP-dependent carboligase
MQPASAAATCRILVCDGETRTALAVVRSLGRTGHQVAVTGSGIPSLAGTSRYAMMRYTNPPSLDAPEEFVARVAQVAAEWRAEYVIPVTDQSSALLLAARDRFGSVRVVGPTIESFRRITDKRALLATAPRFGIRVPRQVVVERRDALDLPADAPLPAVLKPFRSVAGGAQQLVSHATSLQQLRDRLAHIPVDAFPVLVQQRIVGPGIGVFLLIWDGQVVASFAHERLREQPPAGGHAVYCRSIALPKDLAEASANLLRAYDWRGVAMVEFKRDTLDGVPYLMEVNGRFWGSLQLAVDAGVNFPKLLIDAERGLLASSPPSYREDVRLRVWWEDFDLLLTRLRRGPDALQLPPGSRGRLGALLDFLRWSPRERLEALRWDDPSPFGFQTRRWFARRFGHHR